MANPYAKILMTKNVQRLLLRCLKECPLHDPSTAAL